MAVSLSLVMPVFNNADLVIKMWESILQNDFQDWELIAVDDGSSPETVKVLSEYSSRDPRICYLSRDVEPKGAQTCRNIGFDRASGEYVIFFDSDDYITPDCLSVRVKALNANPDMDFIVFPSGVIQNDVFWDREHDYAYGYPIFEDDYDAFARRTLPFIVWNNIYRTSSLRRVDVRWDTNLRSLQDADFNLQCIFAGLRYCYYKGNVQDKYCAKADIGYRIDANPSSVSKKATSPEHQLSMLYAIEKYYRMYHSKFSHKYDYALYKGVLFIYNWTQSDGIVEDFAGSISDIVFRYSKVYGAILKVQICMTKMMQTVMNRKISRQLPMGLHLLSYGRAIKSKRNRIKVLLDKDI